MLPKAYLRIAAGLSGGVAILLTVWLWFASVPTGAPTETANDPSGPATAAYSAPPAAGPVTIPSTYTAPPADPAARTGSAETGESALLPPEEGGEASPAASDTPGPAATDAPASPADLAVVPAPPPPVTVAVLLYHHLEPGADGTNGAVISTAEFERQMAWLKANGYTSITTAQLLNWLEGGQPLPERPVMITFDDGYRSNCTYAYPVLQQHGFNAIVFMLTGLAGQKFGTLEYLTWEDMRAMTASGLIEIHAHSHDGHRYIGEDPALIAWSAEEIRADWHQLTGAMAAAGLPAPTAYAYPFGEYDEECIDALRTAGVKLGFTVEHGRVGPDHDALRLNRLVVYPGTDGCGFARLVTGRSVCH